MKKSLILPDSLRGPYIFESIIDLKQEIYTESPILDMSRVSFIEPYSMLSLLLMGRNYLRESGDKLTLVRIPINIYQYLIRMDFFEKGVFTVPEKLDKKLLLKRSSFSNRVVEIIEIPNKERESVKVIEKVISIFRKRASYILKYWITENIIDYFVTVISEICQNIFEHSLDSGYLAIQTYSVGKENVVRLSVSDSGIGIEKSFESRPEISFGSTSELLKMALTTPISSKREFGYGLCQVNTVMEKLKGALFLRSDNASVTVHYHKKNTGSSYIFLKNGLANFNGTQISISLTG